MTPPTETARARRRREPRAEQPEPRRLLRIKHVCETLCISRDSLRWLIRKGRFPQPIRLLGPTSWPGWYAEQIEEWLAARADEATATAPQVAEAETKGGATC